MRYFGFTFPSLVQFFGPFKGRETLNRRRRGEVGTTHADQIRQVVRTERKQGMVTVTSKTEKVVLRKRRDYWSRRRVLGRIGSFGVSGND